MTSRFMERQFDHKDFEKLLKDNANQYRMYPSEKVWTTIHSALHIRRKWYSISALAVLLLTSAVITSVVFNRVSDKRVVTELKNTTPSEKNTHFVQVTPFEPNKINNSETSVSNKYVKKAGKNTAPGNTFEKSEHINSGLIVPNTITSPDITKNKKAGEESENIAVNNFVEKKSELVNLAVSPVELREENLWNKRPGNNTIEASKISDAINALASQNSSAIPVKRKNKFSTQFYFTPTISYRKLTENKRLYSNSSFITSQVIDINNIVNHKPLMGFEFGVEEKYKLNNFISIKSGLQFNINRYDISAYSHPTEIATVSVNRGSGSYSLVSFSNYGNLSGFKQNWLENYYFQATIPVGAELMFAQRKKVSWGVSGTVQPTYVIGDRAYLISSDYKNYAKFPDLMRRWNLSTGVETFVTYSTGKIKWQTGPHMRYQHLSSFVSGYPVKENLFAIGFKVGATLNYKK